MGFLYFLEPTGLFWNSVFCPLHTQCDIETQGPIQYNTASALTSMGCQVKRSGIYGISHQNSNLGPLAWSCWTLPPKCSFKFIPDTYLSIVDLCLQLLVLSFTQLYLFLESTPQRVVNRNNRRRPVERRKLLLYGSVLHQLGRSRSG